MFGRLGHGILKEQWNYFGSYFSRRFLTCAFKKNIFERLNAALFPFHEKLQSVHTVDYVGVCIHVCMYVCMYVCVYVCMYVHVCMYVCMYVCIYVCINVFI